MIIKFVIVFILIGAISWYMAKNYPGPWKGGMR